MKRLALFAGLALVLTTTFQGGRATAQDPDCKYPWDLDMFNEYCHTTAAVLRYQSWYPIDDIPINLSPHRDNWAASRAIGYLVASQAADVGVSRSIVNISRTTDSPATFMQYVKLHEEVIMSYAVCTAQFYATWFGDEETLDRFQAYLDQPGPNPACIGYIAEISRNN